MEATENNFLLGLIALKDLMIANLTDRIWILNKKIEVLDKENQELYDITVSLMPKDGTEEEHIGFKTNRNVTR